MTALTTVFNYIVAALLSSVAFWFGLDFNPNSFSPQIREYIVGFSETLYSLYPEQAEKFSNGEGLNPILFIGIGVFATGAVIGLVRRLTRG